MNRTRLGAALTAIAIAALPAVAEAKKLSHRGELVGVEGSSVTLRVTVKAGKPRKISGFKAVGVPTACQADNYLFTFQAFDPTTVTKKGNFKERLKNPDGAVLRIKGTVRNRGRKVSGFVSSNEFDGGATTGTCRVPKQAFRTEKR